MTMRQGGLLRWTPAVWALVIGSGACGGDSPAGPGADPPSSTLVIQKADLRMLPGEDVRLTAKDGAGRDVTGAAAWTAADMETVRVEAGEVTALLPGVTWIRAEYGDAVDSVRAVVSFRRPAEEGVALGMRGVLSSPLELTGAAFWHHRLGAAFDHTTLLATPGTFDPETPPGIDFQGNGTQISLSLGAAPEVGVRQLESWTVATRDGGGFELRGPDGVAVWKEDPDDPDRVELYVSVGLFDLEIDRVEPPEVTGLPSGVLAGRVAFDAAGLEVDLSQGPPAIVGQLGTETVRVFAEFQLALRVFPVGSGSIGVEGGSMPFATASIGAPQAGRYRDGLILEYSLALPGADGSITAFANQIWIGSPHEGVIDLEEVGPEAIEGTAAYAPDRAWAWSAAGSDIQAVFRGGGPANAFSSGGSVRVTSYRPAGEDVFGRIEGDFEIPEAVYGEGGAEDQQVVRATFVAPVLPHSLAASQIVPPPEIPEPETPEPEPWRPRIGNGNARIYGLVQEDDLYGLEGVEVRVSGPAGSGTAITNAVGAFAFEGLTPGDYDVEIVVPEGYQLAAHQNAAVRGVNVEKREQRRLDLSLADAQGNGTLLTMAVDKGGTELVDGVTITVVPEAGGDPVATLVTGSDVLGQGWARAKVPPGRYRLVVEPPPGFVLSEDEPDPGAFQIEAGRHRVEVVWLWAG